MLRNLLTVFTNNKEKIAFVINKKKYTYGYLSSLCAAVQKDMLLFDDISPIGILMADDIETYATFLAAIVSNKAYVIINPTNPEQRKRSLLKTAGIRHLYTTSKDTMWVDNNIVLHNTKELIDNLDDSCFSIIERGENSLLYILFTSGSTGKPKGVKISYQNVDFFIRSFQQLGINFTAEDRVLQMFDLTFDVSVAMLLLPLLAGSAIYTVPSGDIKYTTVFKLMIKEKLTYVTLVPSVLTYMKQYFDEIYLPAVRCCIVTAEASYHALLTAWEKVVPNAEIWNLYGPTEATVWCFAHKWQKNCSEAEIYHDMISIGQPLSGIEAIILDEARKIVTVPNTRGELLVAGEQVTSGYLNNPEADEQVFYYLPETGTKFYRTGDLVFRNAHGNMMYCGRMDNQVKIEGFRIELNEIEYQARSCSRTNNSMAFAVQNKIGNLELILTVEKPLLSVAVIKEKLQETLPHYMIPRDIYCFEEFPINSSSKIDRQLLLRMTEEIR